MGAAAEEAAIGAIVTDSAFSDFGDLMKRRFRRFTRLPGIVRPGAMALANSPRRVTRRIGTCSTTSRRSAD
jgi:hypothetical protein